MAIYRTVQLSFWTDPKVLDDFTPEDKYFYLYLFTNPQTNLCGCYELGWTNTTSQLGYNRDSILRLLDRFEKVHKVIKYSKETKEVLILNWHKYNWQGGNQIPCIKKEVSNIKYLPFKKYLTDMIEDVFVEGAYKGLTSPHQATVTVTVNNTDTVIPFKESITNIVNYLNTVVGTNYKPSSKNTVKHITARLNEGYLEEEFYTVIDKMFSKWGSDPKMSQYLRPETLFGSKFESYLNMPEPVEHTLVDEWRDA